MATSGEAREPARGPRPGLAQDRVALVTGGTRADAAAYITGQIWAVHGELDM